MAIVKQPTPVSLFLIFFRLSMAIAKHLSTVSPFLIFCHHLMATAKNLTPVLPFLIFCRHFMAIVKQLTPFPPSHTFCCHFNGHCQTFNPSLAFLDLLSPYPGNSLNIYPQSRLWSSVAIPRQLSNQPQSRFSWSSVSLPLALPNKVVELCMPVLLGLNQYLESRQGRNSKLMNFGRSMDIPASPLSLVESETGRLTKGTLTWELFMKTFVFPGTVLVQLHFFVFRCKSTKMFCSVLILAHGLSIAVDTARSLAHH